MLVNLDTHYLIMEFISWEQLFLCKQVAKSWKEMSIKDCFRPTTLHGIPAFVMIYAWLFCHKHTVKTKPIRLKLEAVKTIWTDFMYDKMKENLQPRYFQSLFKKISSLDTTQMSIKSQIFLNDSSFLKNLVLKTLTINYWMIRYRRCRPKQWFESVEKLVVVTDFSYSELFDHYMGGNYKELEVVSRINNENSPTVIGIYKFKWDESLYKIIAPGYVFWFPTRFSWYKDYALLYIEDSSGIYTRNNRNESFSDAKHEQQRQIIINKKHASDSSTETSNKKQKV